MTRATSGNDQISSSVYRTMKLVAVLVLGYVSLALYYRAREAGGLLTCDCYPDCNADDALTAADFGCFQTKLAGGDLDADCTGDGMLTVADFGCFQTKFVAGCP